MSLSLSILIFSETQLHSSLLLGPVTLISESLLEGQWEFSLLVLYLEFLSSSLAIESPVSAKRSRRAIGKIIRQFFLKQIQYSNFCFTNRPSVPLAPPTGQQSNDDGGFMRPLTSSDPVTTLNLAYDPDVNNSVSYDYID